MSTITPKHDAPAPGVGTLDLGTYFHEIRENVLKLEQAYRDNSLAQGIEEEGIEARFGKPLADCYRELINRPFLRDPRGHRADAVQGLLCQLRDELKGMSTWCYAKPHGRVDAELDASDVMQRLPFVEDALFCVEPATSQQESVVMSFGQMIEARAWGIGFVFNHDCLTEAYVDKAVRKSVSAFVRDLADLGRLLPRVLRAPDRYPPIVPPRYSREFEQLIADILNEHSRHASLSRLIEDYCEKTDLRVHYDGLHRTRGARVQVTFLSDESRHKKKADAIPNQDEFVILSPWSLACAVPGV